MLKQKVNLRKPNKILLLKRLCAYLIDWYLCSLLLIGTNYCIQVFYGIPPTIYMTVESYNNQGALAVIVLMLLVHLFYYVVLVKLLNGSSIGKKILGIKIVSSDNSMPAKTSQLLYRELIGVVLIEGYFSPVNSYLRTFLAMIFTGTKYLNWIWYIICAVSVLLATLSEDQKMIHDMIGKTKVVTIK